MSNIDSWIERDNRQELPEEVYMIEYYEELGEFDSYEEAMEWLMTTELADEEFPEDYIYKVRGE